MAFTVNDALQEMHVLLVKDVDYPDSSEEDYQVRLALLKNAVRVWASEEGVLWRELVQSWEDATGGDKTVSTGDLTINCPTLFDGFHTAYLYLSLNGTSIRYDVVDSSNAPLYIDNPGERACWVVGGPNGGYKIRFSQAIPEDLNGATVVADILVTPTVPTQGSDILQMRDPQFAIYWGLAELIKDEDPGLAGEYSQIAINKLAAMKLKNDLPAYWQQTGGADGLPGFGN